MTKLLSLFILLATPIPGFAGFANFNSVLIGEEAAGMGGAYTALTGDPAAGPFYNPASLARMHGNTLSAAVNVYHKYDTQFGELGDFNQAPLRVNRGTIQPLPAASGTVYTFGNFAFGLSIVFPDFDSYTGEIKSTPAQTSYLNMRDESLWVGGSLAMNLSDHDSVGLTMYYTSRTFTRSVTDQTNAAGVSTVTNEEKSFSQNSLIYILGYHHEFSTNWTFGASMRLPSLPVSGRGTYFESQISSGGGLVTPLTIPNLRANTKIPPRLNLGVAYREPGKWLVSADIHAHGKEVYDDVNVAAARDHIEHVETVNFSVGGEYFLRHWLALRAGLFSNYSSHREIPESPTVRVGDHVDMWGFSTNFAIFTSNASSLTLGGYYVGGKGDSVQRVGQALVKVPKSEQIFSFLVGSAFYF